VVAVGLIAFVAGIFVRGRRGRSPIEDYEERQRREAMASELREKAGTMDEVRLLIERGQKINAIKAFREQTNCGLREAKDAVEALEREMKAGGP
jgi:ribosomal protein L7/L12